MRERPGPVGLRLTGEIRSEPVPRPSGGIRWLIRLAPSDERAYAAPLRIAGPLVAATGGPHAHANRLLGWRDGLPQLEPWPVARGRWRADARRMALRSRVVATADVRDCYASIGPVVVQERLQAIGVSEPLVGWVRAWLRTFADRGVRGLPVGPTPSAVLADAVLSIGDHALRAAGVAHVRWVDDVAIFATGRREAAAALDVLRTTWAAAGLEPNEAKVAIHPDPNGWVLDGGWRRSSTSARCDNPAS